MKFLNSHKGFQLGDKAKCISSPIDAPIDLGDIVTINQIVEDNVGDVVFYFIYRGNIHKMLDWRFEKV